MGSWRLRSPTVLPSASWRTRKAGSIVQSESEGLGTGALMSEGRRRCISQLKQPGKFALLLPFCSIQSLRGLDDTQPLLVRIIFFTQSTDPNANLFWKHPHGHTQIMIYQLPGHPLTQSSWPIKLILAPPNQEVDTGTTLPSTEPIHISSVLPQVSLLPVWSRIHFKFICHVFCKIVPQTFPVPKVLAVVQVLHSVDDSQPGSSRCFFRTRLRSYVLGRVLCSSQHITLEGTQCQLGHHWNIGLNHLVMLVFARSPHLKFTIFPFETYWYLWGGVLRLC